MATSSGAGQRDRVAALLELAAADDAAGFRAVLDAAGGEAAELVNEVELWRGRQSNAYEPRTPLMVAAACGSAAVVALLLGLGSRVVDVNRRPGVDGATALHCAASGGAANAASIVTSLLAAGADATIPDAAGRVPADVASRAGLESVLPGCRRSSASRAAAGKKEYPVDPTLPDMSSSVYASDEFRMFAFKVQPCGRAYAHDWTECPFLHPGENARRRCPRRHNYTAVPCATFRRVDGGGGCPRGDACEFAHGVFESWLHPSQYRTRMCRDGPTCARRICFFAHAARELRHMPRDVSGAGVVSASPRAATMDDVAAALELLLRPGSPPPTGSNGGDLAGDQWLQQGKRLRNSFNDLVSLSRSQHRLSSIRRPPAVAPESTYMAAPPSSRFGNDHIYSPEAAQTSLLLARIRRQQGVRLPTVTQRDVYEFERTIPSPTTIKRHQMHSPAWGSSDAPWLNIACPSSKVDWSFNADKLLRSP